MCGKERGRGVCGEGEGFREGRRGWRGLQYRCMEGVRG